MAGAVPTIAEERMALLYRLMTDELFGDITAEDSKALSLLLQEPWATKEREQFRATFDQQGSFEKVKQLVEEGQSPDPLRQAIRRTTTKRHLLQAGAAGMILVIVALGWFYLAPVRPSSSTLAATTDIQLQLADGTFVSLSEGATTTAGGTTIYNDTAGHQLHYANADAGSHQFNTLRVPPGMDYHIRLADGTEVYLNSASQLSFPFSFTGPQREIRITGEAFVRVAKDATRPFTVQLPHTKVEVLGTSFNVNSYDSAIEKVLLQDGAVRLHYHGSMSTDLLPGTQALVHTGTRDVKVVPAGKDELSWMQGAYVFDNTALSELKALLWRWYGVTLVMDHPSIGNERYSGTILKKESLALCLQTLERTMGLTTYYADGVLHIKYM